MNLLPNKIISICIVCGLIFLSGFWLSHKSKPYPLLFFTLHKLLAMGLLIYLGVLTNQLRQVGPFTPMQLGLLVLSGVVFLLTIVSGGLVSIEKALPPIIRILHHGLPYLTVISTAAYLFTTGK
jgi:hypothetical protein